MILRREFPRFGRDGRFVTPVAVVIPTRVEEVRWELVKRSQRSTPHPKMMKKLWNFVPGRDGPIERLWPQHRHFSVPTDAVDAVDRRRYRVGLKDGSRAK